MVRSPVPQEEDMFKTHSDLQGSATTAGPSGSRLASIADGILQANNRVLVSAEHINTLTNQLFGPQLAANLDVCEDRSPEYGEINIVGNRLRDLHDSLDRMDAAVMRLLNGFGG